MIILAGLGAILRPLGTNMVSPALPRRPRRVLDPRCRFTPAKINLTQLKFLILAGGFFCKSGEKHDHTRSKTTHGRHQCGGGGDSLLGASWGCLGAILGHVGVVLGPLGDVLEPLGAVWGWSWGLLGGSWRPLGSDLDKVRLLCNLNLTFWVDLGSQNERNTRFRNGTFN